MSGEIKYELQSELEQWSPAVYQVDVCKVLQPSVEAYILSLKAKMPEETNSTGIFQYSLAGYCVWRSTC